MNKNDKKAHRGNKGIIDPRTIKDFPVYKEAELLEFLSFKMPSTPRKTLKGLLTHHQVAVGGVPVSQYNYRLYPEDVVTVSKNPIAKRESKGLKIIYEDNDLIAIDKPSGLLSTATEREKGKTAYRMVSDYFANKREGRAFVVHRLDEDTSGVLVFAKSYEVREALQNSWQSIVGKRKYYAIVEGEMEREEGVLRDYLYQDSFQLVRVTKDKDKGKLAITNYRVIAKGNGMTLLDVDIHSGRKNQIRVQLGHIGHYVIGDDKYGEPIDPIKRLGLHAYELSFTNPLNGKEYDFVSPMPQCFKTLFFKKKPMTESGKKANSVQNKRGQKTKSMIKIEKGKQRRAHR